MSASERPEDRAFRELETVVRHLGEELAAFRRRAISAEAQLREAGHAPRDATAQSAATDRVTELERENDALRKRVARAEEQLRLMLDRVRFLRQQLQSQAAGAAR